MFCSTVSLGGVGVSLRARRIHGRAWLANDVPAQVPTCMRKRARTFLIAVVRTDCPVKHRSPLGDYSGVARHWATTTGQNGVTLREGLAFMQVGIMATPKNQ